MNSTLFNILKNPFRIMVTLFSIGLIAIAWFFVDNAIFIHTFNTIGLGGLLTSTTSKSITVFTMEILGWSGFIYAFREFFWQIKRGEYSKFIPLGIMCSGAIFIYTLSRQAKDAMLISVAGSEGATTTKIAIFGFAALYGIYYTYVSRKVSYKSFVLVGMVPILAYFVIFNVFLMGLEPSASILAFKATSPKLAVLCDLAAHWPKTLYYIMSEIFAVAGMGIVWQLANKYVSKVERPRFYSALMIISQFASLSTGIITQNLSNVYTDYALIINNVTYWILGVGVMIFVSNWLFFSINTLEEPEVKKDKTNKSTLGSNLSTWQILKSNPKYIFIGLLVVYYGFCCVFMEQFWKANLKILSKSNEAAYAKQSAVYIILQSRIAIIMACFGGLLLEYFSWFTCAILTPLLVIVGSVLMFVPTLFPSVAVFFPADLTPLMLTCVSGMWIIALFKSLKYATFDTTKEIRTSQFDGDESLGIKKDDIKLAIKNAEITIFGRLGKSGASVIMSLIFLLTGWKYSTPSVSWFLWVFTLIIAALWIYTDIILIPSNKEKDN